MVDVSTPSIDKTLISQFRQQQAIACAAEIENVLQRYGFAMVAYAFEAEDGGIGASLQLIPRQEWQPDN